MNPEPVQVELVVVNRTLRYCSTADLVCDLGEVMAEEVIPPGRWLLDLRTARLRGVPRGSPPALRLTSTQRPTWTPRPGRSSDG